MPGFTLHYLFGVQAYHSLPIHTLKTAIKEHHSSYCLGLQGPDVFFYYPPSHIHKDNIGSIIHLSRPDHLFKAMIDYKNKLTNSEEKEIVTAYIAGFMGHYTLDSTFHPYVYERTDYNISIQNNHEYYGRHFDLEGSFDILYLKKFKGLKPEHFYQSKTIALTRHEVDTIARLLKHIIKTVYQQNHSLLGLKSAITCMRIGTALLHDSTGLKKRFYQKLEHHIFGYEWLSPMFEVTHEIDETFVLNKNHKAWKNLWNEALISLESTNDLLKKALCRYGKTLFLLNNELENGEQSAKHLIDNIGNCSFQTGLEVE